MSKNVIQEYCKTIQKSGLNISTEQLKSLFDLFVLELNKVENFHEKLFLIEQIILPLTNFPHRQKKLSESELITHEIFIIFRDFVIINQLQLQQKDEIIKTELLLNVCRLFSNICYNIDETNVGEIKYLIFDKFLINEIGNCLNEIGKNGKYLNEFTFLRSITFLLTSYKYFRINQILTDEYILINPILEGIIQCLCSSYSIKIIENLEKNLIQKLNDCQMLFLDTMSSYLQWYSTDHRDPNHFILIIRNLLPQFTQWLISCPSNTFHQCCSKVAIMIRHLSCFLIRPFELNILNHFCEEFYSDYCQLVSYWSSALSCLNNNINVKLTTRIIIQNLYNLTLHFNVLNFMKTIPNLISMLLIMTDVNDDEIQLNTYRCLGKIMIEKDIKTMANPDKITSVYIDFIRNTIDDPKNQERFFSLLESLKNFVQHDQVKSELIKQKALPLFIKCVLETRFDPLKAQMICLEILLALSFNSDGYLLLRNNQNLIDSIRILVNSDKPGLRRAAEGLLWKLETEEEAIAKSSISNTYQYDIMISYSHKNPEICLQIHQLLIQDGFNVWIDKDCLRGSTMVGMANAIENSEYVLICMSNYYKQSVYCQSEAHYAFERGCSLIPIIIEQNYKPDGWLGIIVSGKIYVDFANIEFKDAYERLKSEIRQQKHVTKKSNQIITTNNIQPILDLPDCLIDWTNDHVKSFLFQIKLNNTILPLCSNMTGEHLIQLYQICQINRESMFQSLKFELNQRHQTLLTIEDYISFLIQIKQYIPIDKTPQSSFTRCNII